MKERSQVAVPIKVATCPDTPPAAEVERHNMCHLPFRAWCRSCVVGRGKDKAFLNLQAEREHATPTIAHDYLFLGPKPNNPITQSGQSKQKRFNFDFLIYF